jgi:dienelactone hydrolase
MRPITKILGALAAVCLVAGTASAEVKTKEIEYKAGDTTLQGFLAWDDAQTGKRPGVIVVHEWWGHNQHARNQAKRLAQAGYVGFALDMFGKGKLATHPKDAQAFVAEATKDPKTAEARFNAALDLLKKDPRVDPAHIAAIGYCFGGGVVLQMARQGADLDAVASFHGSLAPQGPSAEKGKVKARILVMTGADDPMVPPAVVDAFKKEMTAAGAKLEVISYPGAKHSFTNPDADKTGVPGLAYNAQVDKASWDALLKFLKEVWKK